MPRGIYKSRIGTVVSDKMDKTVVVNVIQIKEHPRYTKAIKSNTTFKAHDESESCQVGDKVLIIETKPTSKTKRWRVSKILERSKLVEAEIAEAEAGLAEEEAEITGIGLETEEPEPEVAEEVSEAPEPEAESVEEAAGEAQTEETETQTEAEAEIEADTDTDTETEEIAEDEEPEDKGGKGE